MNICLFTWLGYSALYVADAFDLYKKHELKLKRLAQQERAERWPNHGLTFWQTLHRFPECHE